jgi:multiple sugar transport system substrate-binding protein
MSIRSWFHKNVGKVCIAALALVTCMVAPLGAPGSAAAPAKAPVTLTFWTWVPNIQTEVNLFQKSHPGITVHVVNAGQGAPEYTKLRTALKAGSGAPDVVQIEFQYLPTFELTGKLVDLSRYGAGSLKDKFVPWTWSQVSQGSKVYAIPQDSGPMGLLYRKDIFDKYHLAVPTTWTQYAQEAATLHKANPKVYMTNIPPNNAGSFFGLMWQAGARPFKVNGTTVAIALNSAAARKVATYWGDLVKAKEVQTTADFTPPWYAAIANGTYASWVTAAWGPVFLAGLASKTAGKWRAAALPQWTAGAHVSGNWGGSSNAVTTQSTHPKEAAQLAVWLNSDPQSAMMLAQKQFLFPVLKSVLYDPKLNTPVSFYGGQRVFSIFVESSRHVDTSFQWSPFQDYVYSQWSNDIGAAINGKGTFAQAMDRLQTEVSSYAKNQGFTVR